MNIPDTKLPRIIVIGGGFGGVSFIKHIRKEAVQVVLFDRHNYHTFQPLLYQVSSASLEPDSIAYPLRKIFRKNTDFHFRMGKVTKIDPVAKKVYSSVGDLHYDYLVIATGTKTNFFGNENIQKFSMPMKTVPQALDIRSLILQNIEEADISTDLAYRKQYLTFVIAGGGPTGVEMAGALAEFRKSILHHDYPFISDSEMEVHLIEGGDRVLPPMSEKASEGALRYLKKLGVVVHLNTLVSDYDGGVITTNTDLTFKTKTFIWAAGVTGAPVEGINAKDLMQRGNRYKVNRFNQVDGFDSIYALGDIAHMVTDDFPNGHPMVAQPAIQQGKNLAENFHRKSHFKALKPFKYRDKGSMATVGRNKAVVDMKNTTYTGAFAWFMWMFVHLWFLIGFRNRVVTFFNWSYNYINYDRAARLIIRPFKRKE